MKKYRFVVVFFFSWSILNAQTNDSFSDGELTANPVWSGDLSLFMVNSSQQLQLNNTVAGASYVSTSFVESFIDDVEWRIFVRQAFSPSANNFGRVYLVSDNSDLRLPLNGYYLQFGEAGASDAIELFRQSGNSVTSVCRAAAGAIASSFSVRIRVTRDTAGVWKISVDFNESGTFVQEASGQDATWTSSLFMGMVCVYTASNSTKFYYDDIYAGPLENGSTIPPSTVLPHDVIITELLPDFSPSIGLPEAEYIEIYNRSPSPINLAGWKLSDGNSNALLPPQQILSHEYRIIIAAPAASLFASVTTPIGVTGLPSLNNDGDALTLKTDDGTLIDSVRYTIAFFKDHDKEDGGWSLERIDLENLCGQEDNWTASIAPLGGTPGYENSVLANKPDLTGPSFISIRVKAPDTLLVRFDEALEKALPPVDSFSISPKLPIVQCAFADLSLQTLILLSGAPFQPGQLYSLSIPKVRDCAGNDLREGSVRTNFALPEKADSMDVVINEVLFNPRPGGIDFIEIYNPSTKFISMDGWKLAAAEEGALKDIHMIRDGVLLSPDSYLVFTSNPSLLKNNYPISDESSFNEVDLPSMPDDAGSVAIVNGSGHLIDYVYYNKDFHSDLVREDEGISLERISPTSPTNNRQNWTSASSQSGFATPGMRNSNTRQEDALAPGNITVAPEIFIPQSGYDDFASINYSFDRPGLVANVRIIDQQGHEIKTIANNETLGFQGFFRWDGDRDDGSRARAGYYILWMEVFDLSGYVHTFRKRVVVSNR